MQTNKQLEIYSAGYAMAHYLEHGNFGKECFMEMTEDEKRFMAVIQIVSERLNIPFSEACSKAALVVPKDEIPTIIAEEVIERLRPSKLPNGLPSRLCADKTSPYFDPACSRVGVKYNGTARNGDVYSYDVAEGWIRVHIRDNKGGWKQSRGRFVTVKLSGIVEPYWK